MISYVELTSKRVGCSDGRNKVLDIHCSRDINFRKRGCRHGRLHLRFRLKLRHVGSVVNNEIRDAKFELPNQPFSVYMARQRSGNKFQGLTYLDPLDGAIGK